MRRAPLALSIVAAVIAATPAEAANLKPISKRAGCREGRSFVAKFAANRPTSIDDWEINRCYRRDRYRIVTEFTIYHSNGVSCFDRGVVTLDSNYYYRWRQFALDCS